MGHPFSGFQMSRTPWLQLALVAVSMSGLIAVKADTISINKYFEATVGTYNYPLDKSGNFAPGYLYVPAENDELIQVIAVDGATIHIFDDAAGTNELAIPSSLNTNGQSQSVSDGTAYNQATVHLTQGWHKLYVTHTVLILSQTEPGNFCRVKFSTAVLHDKIETVSPIISIGDWTGAGNQTSAVTLQLLNSDGVTPAAGDQVTISVDKVTSDPQGQNVLNVPCLTWDNPNQILDSNGSMTATLTWSTACVPCDIQYYIFLKVTDSSQPAPYIPVSGVSAARSRAAVAVAQTAGYTYSLNWLYSPCFGGGGGGGVKIVPKRCISRGRVSHAELTGGRSGMQWGHIDEWKLQIVDQNGAGIHCSLIREAFSNTVKATAPKALAAEPIIKAAPGRPSTWDNDDAVGVFFDSNYTVMTHNYGGATFWYSFTQQWIATTDKEYRLNTHNMKHIQSESQRTVN